MLRVLLVDDEPFILQGLTVLIDWQKEGFEIAGTAANGEEALEFLREQKVDLIIADIRMPIMTGLELLAKIRGEKLSDAYFVILSGYAEFSYAQEAIRYECTDYILKPVEREGLLMLLRNVNQKNTYVEQEKLSSREMERAYLARNSIAIIQGKFDNLNLEYVRKHMHLSEQVRYIEIELDCPEAEEENTDEDKRECQRKLYQACLDFLEEDGGHCVFDVSGHEKIYDIGFVYCAYMAESRELSEKEYLEQFLNYIQGIIHVPVIMLVGKQVVDIANVAKSYHTTCILRSLQGFRAKKQIYYYEEEMQVTSSGTVLCENSLDQLLLAVEQNDRTMIRKSIDLFYEEMQQMGLTADTMTLNINYLLFRLIHLATKQDDGVDQEEIMRLISESTFMEGIERGSKAHLTRFACEYADYIEQLRKNVSRGVLADIEKEIREHYSENLTLKGLSEKYYVNSAYLGQMFRKKYGQSFKDYLNIYRIETAALKLIRTNEKIYQIAEGVGYHDLDYFVNRFIQVKGCTPAKFRRQAQLKQE
ncbi:response regulator transcription factor [Anaerosporobacter sp.]|uniref:response regulator transcription factor n=1 Tax=Anaerosporobacter sp. TaxID=1872529 RepID=UPI00286F7AB7|nr:response regulator [Anaerosporobacter sp.]